MLGKKMKNLVTKQIYFCDLQIENEFNFNDWKVMIIFPLSSVFVRHFTSRIEIQFSILY